MKKPYIQLHFLVLILAFTAVLGHLISLPAVSLVIWRTGIAVVAFFLLLRPKAKQGVPVYRGRALLTGGVLGLHWMCFFGAVKLANITTCLTGVASLSLFTAIAEAIQEKRRPRPDELVMGCVLIPALILVAGVADGHLLGLVCAIISAVLAAIFTVINKSMVRSGVSASSITQYEMLGACLTCIGSSFLMGMPISDYIPQGYDWLWLFALASICTVYAFTLNIQLLQHFTAFEANLAINLEPVYGILLAAFIFHEHEQMRLLFFVGAAMIVATNLAHPLIRRRFSR